MLLEKHAEITPERMKRQSKNKNNTQLLLLLMMEVKSDAVKEQYCIRSDQLLSRVPLFATP